MNVVVQAVRMVTPSPHHAGKLSDSQCILQAEKTGPADAPLLSVCNRGALDASKGFGPVVGWQCHLLRWEWLGEERFGGKVGNEAFCFRPVSLSCCQDSVLSSMKWGWCLFYTFGENQMWSFSFDITQMSGLFLFPRKPRVEFPLKEHKPATSYCPDITALV